MSTIVAIGGGELKDLDTLLIDRAIVKLTHKKHPKVLFIPTASNDSVPSRPNQNGGLHSLWPVMRIQGGPLVTSGPGLRIAWVK